MLAGFLALAAAEQQVAQVDVAGGHPGEVALLLLAQEDAAEPPLFLLAVIHLAAQAGVGVGGGPHRQLKLGLDYEGET